MPLHQFFFPVGGCCFSDASLFNLILTVGFAQNLVLDTLISLSHIYTDDSQMYAATTDLSFRFQVHVLNCLLSISIQCFISTLHSASTKLNSWSASLKPDPLSSIPYLRKWHYPVSQSKSSRNHPSLSRLSPPPTSKQSPILFILPPKSLS